MSRVNTAIHSGIGAALAVLAATTLLSRHEGHSALRPVNATSHVLWGRGDAARDDADLAHTAPGLVINLASAFFWSGLFALAAPTDPKRSPTAPRLGTCLARSVALALAAMGAGLAAGGFSATRRAVPGEPETGE